MTKLDSLLESLKKADRRLKGAAKARPTKLNRDATIQRFEFTFELCWKVIQEYVKDQGLDARSPKQSIREGAKIGILDNPEEWFEYLECRNLSAHTCNEETADRVYRRAVKFPVEVKLLLSRIR